VGEVISLSTSRTAIRAAGGRRFVEPVVAEIISALQSLGGAAHRQVVADLIAEKRAGRRISASSSLRQEVFEAFNRYVETVKPRRAAALLYLPLGPESYRWALAEPVHQASPVREAAH